MYIVASHERLVVCKKEKEMEASVAFSVMSAQHVALVYFGQVWEW